MTVFRAKSSLFSAFKGLIKLGNVCHKLGFYSMSSFQNSLFDQYFTSGSKVIENIKCGPIDFCTDYNFVEQFFNES